MRLRKRMRMQTCCGSNVGLQQAQAKTSRRTVVILLGRYCWTGRTVGTSVIPGRRGWEFLGGDRNPAAFGGSGGTKRNGGGRLSELAGGSSRRRRSSSRDDLARRPGVLGRFGASGTIKVVAIGNGSMGQQLRVMVSRA